MGQQIDKDPLLTAHEVLCALRYKNIEEKLDAITETSKTTAGKIENVQKLAYVAFSAWVVTLVIGTILGIVISVIKIAESAN